MSDVLLKFALTNGGFLSCRGTLGEVERMRDVIAAGGCVAIPGHVINSRHIVFVETEAAIGPV